MRQTWYVLEGGSVVDPCEVAPDAGGVLRHVTGVAVAMGPYGPLSRSMGPDEIAALAPTEAKPKRGKGDRQMNAAAGAGYETR